MPLFSKILEALKSSHHPRPEDERMAYNDYVEHVRKSEYPMLKGSSVLVISTFTWMTDMEQA
jgi:hypothetical protein